jgi:hypothetical protein
VCTGILFLLKTAYGYGNRVFVRRLEDCVADTYLFVYHVDHRHVLCFLFPFLQAACKGDPKWNQFVVSCHAYYQLMNL